MKIAYFDCFSGAAGDMIVGALLDAMGDAPPVLDVLNRLGIGGYKARAEKVVKQGIAATHFVVDLDSTVRQPHRHLKHVVEVIRSAKLSTSVTERAIRVFTRLAEAEAAVHATTIEKVHFHEVGAVDAIVDVIGACLCLEELGVEQIHCSLIPTGHGTVTCEHGVLPVPAPATALLLKGVPLAECAEMGELTTPTGAAVLTSVGNRFGPPPAMTIGAIGYGAGTRDSKTRPNVLRVMVGESSEPSTEAEQIVVMETNLDDTTPQVVGYCIERLLAEGALDAFAMPIQMKKGRLGVLLTVLAEVDRVRSLERILFQETPTLGVRRRTMQRTKLARRQESVNTVFGEIRMKIGEFEGVVTATPEFDDCKAAALRGGTPLREVIAAADHAWRSR